MVLAAGLIFIFKEDTGWYYLKHLAINVEDIFCARASIANLKSCHCRSLITHGEIIIHQYALDERPYVLGYGKTLDL